MSVYREILTDFHLRLPIATDEKRGCERFDDFMRGSLFKECIDIDPYSHAPLIFRQYPVLRPLFFLDVSLYLDNIHRFGVDFYKTAVKVMNEYIKDNWEELHSL